jgi:hypothetical protein
LSKGYLPPVNYGYKYYCSTTLAGGIIHFAKAFFFENQHLQQLKLHQLECRALDVQQLQKLIVHTFPMNIFTGVSINAEIPENQQFHQIFEFLLFFMPRM